MDAEQNDTTDSNIVEDTRDALCEDAESLESTEKDAEINGNGDTDENDGASGGASGGDGAAGNDDDAADDGEMEEEEEEEEEATPPGNVETIVELEDIYPFPEKNNPPDDDGPESERKRSIDDAECDDYGPLPTFPLKRARTAYFIFADEKRKAVSQEVCPPSLRMDHLCRYPDDFSDSFSLSRHAHIERQHQGEGVAAVAKAIGQLWSALDPSEKEVYESQAAKEKERVGRDMQRLKDAGRWPEASADASAGEDELIFPIGRIRKICKLDPDVRGISKESALLITKATELFCNKLGKECVIMAQMQNRRTLVADDILEVCSAKEAFMFLRPDMVDLRRAQQAEMSQKKKENGKERATKAGEESVSKNNLDSYFGKITH